MTASIFCSTRQFTAAADPATSQIPTIAASSSPQRHHARRREEHADRRAEHDERHHARLGERQELAQAQAGCVSGRTAWRKSYRHGPIRPAKPGASARGPSAFSRRVRITRKAQHQASQRIDDDRCIRRVSRRESWLERRPPPRRARPSAPRARAAGRGSDRRHRRPATPARPVRRPCRARGAPGACSTSFSAAIAAGGGVDLEQHPLAAQLREPERARRPGGAAPGSDKERGSISSP